MARPISWLHRLHDIRRSVAESVRSVYTRHELQTLFQVQLSSAKELMALFPTYKLQNIHVVEREALLAFLERVQEAEDVPALLKQVKAEKASVVRTKLRNMVRRDIPEASLAGTPDTLKLERGKLQINFPTMDELLRTLVFLALIVQGDDLEEFIRLYEPVREKLEVDPDEGLAARLEAALEERRAEIATESNVRNDAHL